MVTKVTKIPQKTIDKLEKVVKEIIKELHYYNPKIEISDPMVVR